MSTAGFYTKDLRYSNGNVHGPGFSLLTIEKDSYSYPIHGWTWYNSREDAIIAALGDGADAMMIEQQRLAMMIQDILDAQAQKMNFDSILSGISYAIDRQSMFYNDAIRLTRWRSKVWEKAYEIKNSVLSGGNQPTDEELLAQLPAFE